MERTLIIVKPDGVQRGLIGTVLSRFEQKGLKITGLKMTMISKDLAETHYGHLSDKPFFPNLVDFITSSPVVIAVLEGPNAISMTRNIVGVTNPAEAGAGTLRGDYALEIGMNLIHASDAPETAEAEVKRFFSDDEVAGWDRAVDQWIFED